MVSRHGMPLATGRQAASLLPPLLAPLAVVVIWVYSGGSLEKRFAQTSFDSASNKAGQRGRGLRTAEERTLFQKPGSNCETSAPGNWAREFPNYLRELACNAQLLYADQRGRWHAGIRVIPADFLAGRCQSHRCAEVLEGGEGEAAVFDGVDGESLCVSCWIFLWQCRLPTVSVLSGGLHHGAQAHRAAKRSDAECDSAVGAGSHGGRGSRLGLRLGLKNYGAEPERFLKTAFAELRYEPWKRPVGLPFRNRNHLLGMHEQFVEGERVPDFDKEHLPESSLTGPAIVPPDTATVAGKTEDQKTLDRMLIRGVAWTAAVKWLTQIFTWGPTVVVARLLLPCDYGWW